MHESLQRALIWAGFSPGLSLLGVRWPNLARTAIGIFRELMAVMVRVYATPAHAEIHAAWADTALRPLYCEAIVRLVAPNPALLVLPVAAYEIAVAIALLRRGAGSHRASSASCRRGGRRKPTSFWSAAWRSSAGAATTGVSWS